MRVVLDTNVVLSALLWRGAAFRLLQLIRQRERIQLFTSSELLVELGDVLARTAHADRLRIVDRTAHEILTDYAAAVELVSPFSTPAVVTADPDDDQVIAAAIAADATMIVTGDRHLLAIGSYGSIRIVSAAEASRLLELSD